jgi:hypothetical protein
MTGEAQTLRVEDPDTEILLSTCLDESGASGDEEICLRLDEGLILRAPAPA